MKSLTWFWTGFISLTWWQMILWFAYAIYFVVTAYAFWDYTSDSYGLRKGYRRMIFGRDKYFRLYHIAKIVFTIPPATLGLTFPFLRKVLAYRIYQFKDEKKITDTIEKLCKADS